MDKKDIYCITNNINGMQYVGQSKDAHKRFKAHALAKDKTYFHSAIRKYGIDNFSLEELEFCENDEIASLNATIVEKETEIKSRVFDC